MLLLEPMNIKSGSSPSNSLEEDESSETKSDVITFHKLSLGSIQYY